MVVSRVPVSDEIKKFLQYKNATLGQKDHVRIFLLVWKNKDRHIMTQQEHFWRGANRNGLVLCCGLSSSGLIQWTDGFCHHPDGYAGNFSLLNTWKSSPKGKLDLSDFGFIENGTLSRLWKPKPIEELEYVPVETPLWAIILTHVSTLAAVVGIGVWCVKNDLDLDEKRVSK